MRSYDIPETDFLTAEQASAAVRRLHADCQSDLEHPFLNRNHAQHRDFADYSAGLYRIIVEGEAEEKDAAAAAALEDALAETQGLSPAECLARATKLTLTPGYVNGTMPPEERAKLAREITTLYRAGSQQEPDSSTPEEEEISDDL